MHASFGDISVIHRCLFVESLMQRVNSVCFNNEGTVFASGSYDTTVKLWDVRTHDRGGQCIQTLPEAKDSIVSVILDETSIISGFFLFTSLSCRSVDGSIRSYDIRAGMMNQEQLNGMVCGSPHSQYRSAPSRFLAMASATSPARHPARP